MLHYWSLFFGILYIAKVVEMGGVVPDAKFPAPPPPPQLNHHYPPADPSLWQQDVAPPPQKGHYEGDDGGHDDADINTPPGRKLLGSNKPKKGSNSNRAGRKLRQDAADGKQIRTGSNWSWTKSIFYLFMVFNLFVPQMPQNVMIKYNNDQYWPVAADKLMCHATLPHSYQCNFTLDGCVPVDLDKATNIELWADIDDVPTNLEFIGEVDVGGCPTTNDEKFCGPATIEFNRNNEWTKQVNISEANKLGHPVTYPNVKAEDGCKLITCDAGRFCGIRTDGIAKLGDGQFEPFLFPKCVSDVSELTHNTDNDGNSHIEIDGPGCGQTDCSEGYQCAVRIGVTKLGKSPYSQSISGYPQCVKNATDYDDSVGRTVVEGGEGCEKVSCTTNGTTCMVSSGIAKYGPSAWKQFFWPYCG